MNRKMNWCWISILALVLSGSIMGCSGAKSQVVSDTEERTAQETAKPQPGAVSSPSPQKEIPPPAAPAQVTTASVSQPSALPDVPAVPSPGAPALATTGGTPQFPASPVVPPVLPPGAPAQATTAPGPQPSAMTPVPPSSPAAALPPTASAPLPPGRIPVPPASQPPPSMEKPQGAPQAGAVAFSFDNADIYEFIRVMSELLKFTYIVDPRVKGTVNIKNSGQIAPEDLFPIFQSILRLNGATAVKKGGIYEIVPMTDARKVPVAPTSASESGKISSDDRFLIQIVSLKYIPVAEVSKMIKPFLSDGADVIEYSPSNLLIISDVASNVKKSVDIINLFDIDIFSNLRVRIYPIINADVTEVSKEMDRIFSSFEVSTKSGRGVGITFTPITRINSLLVVSSIPNIFDRVEGWVKELDKIPMEGTKYSVFVYYVQNAKAKDLADVLKQVFAPGKEKKTEYKEKVVEQPTYPKGVKPPSTPAPTPTPASKEEGTGVAEGEINIVVDESNNALVVRAFARDYKNILETIRKLDIYPKQVLIEAYIAEITLEDAYSLGIEWAQFSTKHGGKYFQTGLFGSLPTGAATPTDAAQVFPGNTTVGAVSSISSNILQYSIVDLAGKYAASIQAAAGNNRTKIISSPNLIASNNKEAKMQIGKSQPVLTNTYSYGSSTTTGTTPTTGTIEGTIEYKDIGVIVTITPRISDGGLITLEIQIEKSDIQSGQNTLGNLQNVPVFTKKTAKTTVSVLEGQTIVIGGLIEDTKTVKKSGIPFLSSIPIIGALFGNQGYDYAKEETVVLLTPHIITDHIQSVNVTEEFKNKVEGLKKDLEKENKKKERKEK